MKFKRVVLAMMFVVLAFSVSACGEKKDKEEVKTDVVESVEDIEEAKPEIEPEAAVPFEPVAGEMIDAGNIRAICPEGWFNYPVVDYFSEDSALDPDKLTFLRGTDDSLTNLPHIAIGFYGADNELMPYEDQKAHYETAVDIAPFMIGEDVWEGIRYNLGDDVTEALISKVGVGAFAVLVRLEGAGEVISLTDADVQTILSSIAF